jgi:hypothetical protein
MPTKLTMELDGEEVLADVQRMRLLPGDVVVIKAAVNLTRDQRIRIEDYARAQMPDHQILVLDGALDMSVVPAGGSDGAN